MWVLNEYYSWKKCTSRSIQLIQQIKLASAGAQELTTHLLRTTQNGARGRDRLKWQFRNVAGACACGSCLGMWLGHVAAAATPCPSCHLSLCLMQGQSHSELTWKPQPPRRFKEWPGSQHGLILATPPACVSVEPSLALSPSPAQANLRTIVCTRGASVEKFPRPLPPFALPFWMLPPLSSLALPSLALQSWTSPSRCCSALVLLPPSPSCCTTSRSTCCRTTPAGSLLTWKTGGS